MNKDKYTTYKPLPNGNAIVSIADDGYFMINDKGENISGTVYSSIWRALCMNKKAPAYYCIRALEDDSPTKVGLIDTEGKLLIPPKYVDIRVSDTTEGLFLLYCPGGGMTFIYGGKTHTKVYHRISDFIDGYAVVTYEYRGWTNLINLKGETIFPDDAQYKNVTRPHNGVCAVSKMIDGNEIFGYVDLSNKVIIPFQFENVHSFNRGFAKVKFSNKTNWNVIDMFGNIVGEIQEPVSNTVTIDWFVNRDPFDSSIPESAYTANIDKKDISPITFEESHKIYSAYKQYRSNVDSLIGKSVRVEKPFEIEYLEYYAAPYTGSNSLIIPKGTILSELRKMNDKTFYCDCSDNKFCERAYEETKRKIRESMGERFYGIGFFITYEQCIKFCSIVDK
jgi:hypothetical protein